jgi:hypothetical protein
MDGLKKYLYNFDKLIYSTGQTKHKKKKRQKRTEEPAGNINISLSYRYCQANWISIKANYLIFISVFERIYT